MKRILMRSGLIVGGLVMLAAGTAKTAADTEWQTLIRELDTSGMREILGSSLLVEVTP